MSYEFENMRVVDEILRNSAKKVLLQLPDGLKPYSTSIVEEVRKKTGATIYVSADPCYGACDIAEHEAEILNVDLLIHYGHTPIPLKTKVKVVYIEVKANLDVDEVVEKTIPFLKDYQKIGLVTTVQHINELGKVKFILEKHGKKTIIGSAGGLVKYDGQVLGCDYTTAEKIEKQVDAYLYVGGGLFHPKGILLITKKPVIVADPYLNSATSLEGLREKLIKKRNAAMAMLTEAKNVGIIVGLRLGQTNLQLAEALQEKLESMGKHTIVLCLREIIPETLSNFPNIEVFVNTACPRIGLDDPERYGKPIVTAKEAFGIIENPAGSRNDG